jgi:hypothetical protein
MGYCRLGLAASAAFGFLIAAAPVSSAGVAMPAAPQVSEGIGLAIPAAFHGHAGRTQSYYCYPKNYWWFYRPYNTAYDGHARCMPYFHYLEPGRGANGRVIK